MAVGTTKVVQVTNIAPQATKDQMQTLFGYLGKIEDIRLYPTIRDVAVPVQSRICYIKFHDQNHVSVAQHMTNTVFIDRALIVVPYQHGDIPDEQRALELTNNGTAVPVLYPNEPKLPPNVVNAIDGVPPNHSITTMDPKLEANGLPVYPPLPGHLDSRKIEEIRRTLLIGNLEASTTDQQIIEFFGNHNLEVKYIRLCTRDSDTDHYALVEFTEQASIVPALQLNGQLMNDKAIKMGHSVQAIIKPEAKSNEAAQKEIEEAISRVNLISATIDPLIGILSKDKRSRSGSRSRKSRSRSRGRSRRSRSRKRSRSRHRRSRSRHRRRSRSRSRKRSRSRERRRKSRSRRRSTSRDRRSHRSRSRDRRSRSRRSRSRSKDRKKKSSPARKRSRSRSGSKTSKSHSRKSRSKSKSRSSKSKYSEKSRDKDKDKDKDKEKEHRSKDKSESNGKKSSSSKDDREKSEDSRSEKKSKDKKSDKDDKKSEEKSRASSEYSDKEKQDTKQDSEN